MHRRHLQGTIELKARREKREMLKKDKAIRVAAEKVEKEALAILATKPGDTADKKFTGSQLKILLSFYGVKKNQGKNVAEMRAKYKELKEKNAAPIKYKKWTDAKEAKLTNLMKEKITIDETELGRQRAQLKKQKKEELAAFAKDNPEEAARILASMLVEANDNPNPSDNPFDNPNPSDDETVVPTQPWL